MLKGGLRVGEGGDIRGFTEPLLFLDVSRREGAVSLGIVVGLPGICVESGGSGLEESADCNV